MDLLEYFDFLNTKDSSNRLDDLEKKTIVSLFNKYIPNAGRMLVVSPDNPEYAFIFADMGYKVTVTYAKEESIAELKNDPRASSLESVVNTSLNLSAFKKESFDIIVSFGTMFRLQNKAEREAFTKSALRVLVADGHIAYSYMTPLAMTFGQYFDTYKTANASSKLRSFRQLAAVEKTHSFNGFFGLTLDEMTDISREYNIDIQTVAATYPMIHDFTGEIEGLSDEDYNKFVEEQISVCEDPFITRYCMRGLFIGKKKNADLFD